MSIMLLFSGIKPTEAHLSLIQKGKASFYSKRFHGRKTSNGEKIKEGQLTAAHLTLPMNTLVEVTNLDNNRSVVVRINDRGPHGKGRIIDLAYSAAQTLGMLKQGIANVAIKVVGHHRSQTTEPTAQLLSDYSLAAPELAPVSNF
jgi:rare lipoprotein A